MRRYNYRVFLANLSKHFSQLRRARYSTKSHRAATVLFDIFIRALVAENVSGWQHAWIVDGRDAAQRAAVVQHLA